jgi:glycosyltransferase involved in cell wall biosynthesis
MDKNKKKKSLKILISVFACNPKIVSNVYPGEAILGWNLISQISKSNYTFVITHKSNKLEIEKKKNSKKIYNILFYYLELPKLVHGINKNYFGRRLYYFLWQIKAYFFARVLHKKFGFNAFHQITFSNDWMPSYIGAYLPISFLWGPAGGGQKVPSVLGRELPLGVRINEIARNLLQEFWRHTPSRIIGMKKAKAVLVCNKETRKKVEKFSNKVYDFPVNGISREELSETSTNKPTHRPTNGPTDQRLFRIIYAGRFDPIKGIPLGIRAFAEFHKKYPDSIFEIIGEGPDEVRIKRELDKFEIGKSVKLIPWLSREKLLEKMRESDVLLFPSFRDGGGAVIVEAMASGIPVICLNLAGPGFHIKDEWGLKIKPESPDYVVKEMSKALECLYLNEDLRKEMGKRARERAEVYYLWEHLGNRLNEIYDEVMEVR